MMRSTQILIGHAPEQLAALPEQSVQCCISSPPYWGLRSYLPKDHPLKHLEIGSEKTPAEYVAKIVEVFRGVKRVLRDDGVLWLNVGDSYASAWAIGGQNGRGIGAGSLENGKRDARPNRLVGGLKEKDLIGIPWLVASALREDGWYLRARCPWIKRNGMPESTDDRPTTVVEDIFLLSKSADYFYDSEATRMPYSDSYANDPRHQTGSTEENEKSGYEDSLAQNPKKLHRLFDKPKSAGSMRRSTSWFFESWQGLISNERGEPLAFMVNTASFGGAHFATFPKRLVIPMIQAGTSEKGCCAQCGAAWVREIDRTPMKIDRSERSPFDGHSTRMSGHMVSPSEVITKGWKPTCECCADLVPCVVLDPFGGSGTVGEVAKDMNRSAILIDLNDGYKPLLESRCLPGPGEFDL